MIKVFTHADYKAKDSFGCCTKDSKFRKEWNTEVNVLTDSELRQRDEQMRREGFQAAYREAIVWNETTEEEFQVVWTEAFDDYLKSLEEEK